MSTEAIRIRPADRQAMLDHVLAALPEEACGLLGGRDGAVRRVIPVANAARSATRFRMQPEQQVRAMLALEAEGLEMTGIFHSHPEGPPGPSATDLAEAAYPQAAYLIWSPGPQGWACHAFRLEPDGARPIALVVD